MSRANAISELGFALTGILTAARWMGMEPEDVRALVPSRDGDGTEDFKRAYELALAIKKCGDDKAAILVLLHDLFK